MADRRRMSGLRALVDPQAWEPFDVCERGAGVGSTGRRAQDGL